MKASSVLRQPKVCHKMHTVAHNRVAVRVLLILATLIMGFCFTSCASARNFTTVDRSAFYGDFSTARVQLEEEKNNLYSDKDKVLYALDAGMLSHYGGNYEQSNTELTQAERLIEEYFAVSFTQSINSFLLNDTVIDYAGEDYEDIYINLFMALNYIQLGNTEAAFVEIRRFDNKLKLISAKYAEALIEAKQDAAEEDLPPDMTFSGDNDFSVLEFHNSALARYVSMLLYRSIGQMDSAEIDRKFIQSAFQTQQQLYSFPMPVAIAEEFSIPDGKNRLNFFCYAGLAPEKHEEVLRVPGLISDTWFKLALPVMVKRASAVSSILITAFDEQGQTTTGKLELLESVENIVVDTFKQRQSLIYVKSVLRAISKSTTSGAIGNVIDNQGESLLGDLFRIASNVFIEVSEQADLRTARYFPAQVWVGGLNLDPGTYTVVFTCYDAWDNILYEETKLNVPVTGGKVNLVEAICIQ